MHFIYNSPASFSLSNLDNGVGDNLRPKKSNEGIGAKK